jgi:hypothetical protein
VQGRFYVVSFGRSGNCQACVTQYKAQEIPVFWVTSNDDRLHRRNLSERGLILTVF